MLRFPTAIAPLAPGGIKEVLTVPLHSTKSDTHPEVFLISKQVFPYRITGDTCCPGEGVGEGSTPRNSSLAVSRKTNHKP
jgi:hypothetical protein